MIVLNKNGITEKTQESHVDFLKKIIESVLFDFLRFSQSNIWLEILNLFVSEHAPTITEIIYARCVFGDEKVKDF